MHYEFKAQRHYQIHNRSLIFVTLVTNLFAKFEIFVNKKHFFTTRAFSVGIFDMWFGTINIYFSLIESLD